jgi:DNA-binding NarL/FixJ family response regulator
MKVLIVDDHALFRLAFIQFLKSQMDKKLLCFEAKNGQEALDLVKETKFDLVFLDIGMPVMNGYETIQEMKSMHPLQKIIILTQHFVHYIPSYFTTMGVSFLSKDVDESEMVNAIKSVLEGRQYIQTIFRKTVKSRDNVDHRMLEFTIQERKLIQLLGIGRSSKEIANDMGLKPKTIETYRERLFKKTHVKNVAELMSFAFKNGVMTVD